MSICPCISTAEDTFLSIKATKLHLSQTTSDGSSIIKSGIRASEQKQNILKTKQNKKKTGAEPGPALWLVGPLSCALGGG